MSQKDLIILHPNRLRPRDIIPQQNHSQTECILLPPRETGYKVIQRGMYAESLRLAVLIMRVQGKVNELRRLFASWSTVAAEVSGSYAGVFFVAFGWVEDSLNGVGPGF